ncbi:MAG: Uncharacterised protein [Bacteroidota bacterium]|nr:MAG: Uncharacterised protein [Bacteroidota bacterium]
MRLPLFGRNKKFYFIGKKEKPNFIVVLQGRKGKGCCNFGNRIAFELLLCSKIGRATNIYQKHKRKLAFFFKNLYVRFLIARSNIPIYGTDIVAILVLTHLAKGHTTTFKGTLIFPPKNMIAQSAGFNLNLPNFL